MFTLKRIVPGARLDDLPLPADRLARLCMVASTRKGVVLLGGPSGKGRAHAAEVIASTMGCDLMRVDLGKVASRYIGETEGNLDRIFATAATNVAALLFDNADALFGERGDIKAGHDRHADAEVDHLLQRMERQGARRPCTRIRQDIDAAFARRSHGVAELYLPPNPG